MSNRVVIGSRGSRLALVQAGLVADALRMVSPGLEVEIKRIVTSGDTNRHVPLETVAGMGIFVKELEEALLDRRIDLAVHSLKDMPTELPSGLLLAAIPERQNPADALISGGGKLAELPAGARIGTGSLRRAALLKSLRPDLEPVSIRGNVDTRIKKVTGGELEGVILAAAALLRLGWEDRITEYLPVDSFVPAVGQGALAIETRADDPAADLAALLEHTYTRNCVIAERAFLRALGGGCRAPIAALATIDNDKLTLNGLVADPSGGKIFRGKGSGNSASAEEIGARLAARLLSEGADMFLESEE